MPARRHASRRLRRVLIGSAAAALIAVILVAVHALRPPQSIAPPAQVLSNYEHSTGADVARDCGYSQPLPADPSSSLWLFCDTDVYAVTQGKWRLSEIISGSTAAEGPVTAGEVPVDLSELTTPRGRVPAMPSHRGPAQFLPTPSGLKTDTGLDCDSANGAYAASWPTGVTRDAARNSDLLISFNNYCVAIGSESLIPEGFGLAQYDPVTNVLNGLATVFAAAAAGPLEPQELLGSPIFSGAYLYLYASRCAEVSLASCVPGGRSAIYLARVSARPSAWSKARGYQWFAGRSTWTASASAAVSVLPGAAPLGVSVANFSAVGRGLVLIEQINDVGRFVVYEAASPAGGWRKMRSGTVPCAIRGASFCRAIIGHPDLSTGSELLVSYFNPAAEPYYNPSEAARGHVMVAAFRW